MLYNINIQFPNHHFIGQVTLITESFENGLITTFPAINECEERSQSLMNIFAEFYQFGADYFEKGKVSGDDVAAKLRMQLGEIWLGNRAKSHFGWHFIGVWPHSINFGELCFSSDPTVDIEVTWKYKKIELCNAISQ